MKRRLLWAVLLLACASSASAMEKRPLLYSLLLPGWGEWSLGYKGRAVGHWVVEAGCWTANFYYRDQGFEKRHEYEAYADAHWHTARWASAFSEEQPDWLDWIPAEEWSDYAWDELIPSAVEFDDPRPGYLESHFAPFHEDPQHYYENLGKYDWYRWGWDDYSQTSDNSAHRYVYLNMRNASDDDFNRAHNFIIVMLLARVVSIVDTYLILHRMESGSTVRELQTGWRLDFTPTDPVRAGFRLGLTRSW